MESLSKTLRKQGYDLIDGPVRNHRLKQVWYKKPFEPAEIFCDSLHEVFQNEKNLRARKYLVLEIDSHVRNKVNMKTGLSVLKSLTGIFSKNAVEIEGLLARSNSISMAFNDTHCSEISVKTINNFLESASLKEAGKSMIKWLNKDHLLIVTGMLYAKRLMIAVERDFNLDSDLLSKLEFISKGSVQLSRESSNRYELELISEKKIPVAIKAHRIVFRKGVYSGIRLITDSRGFF